MKHPSLKSGQRGKVGRRKSTSLAILMWASTAASCISVVRGTNHHPSRVLVPAFQNCPSFAARWSLPRQPKSFPTTRTESRFSSSAMESSNLHQQKSDDGEEAWLDTSQFPMELPKSLSPSAAMEFKKCPQSYLFKYIYKLKEPTNQALVRGTICHTALEQIFDLPPEDRTLENLQNLFRVAWAKIRHDEPYQHLFDPLPSTSTNKDDDEDENSPSWDIQQEIQWGKEALQLLENYIEIEDPSRIEHPNPHKREMWLHQHLTLDPTRGVTGYTAASESNHDYDDTTPASTFYVRGIVDRLDMIRLPSFPQQVGMRIVDYKTGKSPNFKYSPAMNEEIAQDAFYQLKIYALLIREREANLKRGGGTSSATPTAPLLPLQSLRLLYLNSESGKAQYLDMDLGETLEERDAILQETHQDLSMVWKNIQELVQTQNPKAFKHCDRTFCYCHTCRPKFVPGTLAE